MAMPEAPLAVQTAGGARRLRRAVVVGWLGTILGMVLTAAGLAVHQVVPPADRVDFWGTPQPMVGLFAGVVGALIANRRPGNRVAWLLVVSGALAGVYCAALAFTEYGQVAAPAAAWLPWTGWVTTWSWLPVLLICLVVLPQVFPDGVTLPGAWRWWWRATLAIAVLVAGVLALAPEATQFPGLANPLIVTGDARWLSQVGAVLTVVFGIMAAGSIASIVVRFRRSSSLLRRQIGLVSIASAVLIVSDFADPRWLASLACAGYLAAVLVAVARYRLYDIDLLVSRGAVGFGLVVILGALYAVTVAGVGALAGKIVGPGMVAFAGALVVALAFAPIRDRIRRIVDRAFSLGRPDPRDLLASVTNLIRDAPSPRQAVDEVVELLGDQFSGRVVWIEIGAAVYLAGDPPGDGAVTVPLRWQGREVGRVMLAADVDADWVSSVDRRTLAILAPALGALAQNLLVTRDLDLSRQTIMSAREEERRRLRRDLHDGLGPLLAGAAMSIDAACAVSAPGPDRQLLDDARSDVRRAIGDIRQLVYGLRPATLDDLGLAGAIRSSIPTGRLALTVVADDLDDLPAAVEVAAFRITQEALTNVIRHAGARSAEVRLRRSARELRIEVVDDGCGVHPGQPRGIGLNSMRERAAEVGGRLTVGPAESGGTRVWAVLPCAVPS